MCWYSAAPGEWTANFYGEAKGLAWFLIWHFVRHISILSIYILSCGPMTFLKMLGQGELQYHESYGESLLWLVFLLIWGFVYVVVQYRRLKQMAVEMADDYIVRRDGTRITRIARNEIATAQRTGEGFELKSIDRVQTISIPEQTAGSSEIQSLVRRWIEIPVRRETTLFEWVLMLVLALMVLIAIYMDATWLAVVAIVAYLAIFAYIERKALSASLRQQVSWKSLGTGAGYLLLVLVMLAATIAFGLGVYTLAMMLVG